MCFLKACNNLYTLKSRGSVAAGLLRIASNTVADHYRFRSTWIVLSDELESVEPEQDRVAELAGCLRPLVDDLPETCRSALILSEIEGCPQEEVARLLGIAHSGEKFRVQRGRGKLRKRLHACCIIEAGRCSPSGRGVHQPRYAGYSEAGPPIPKKILSRKE